MGCLLSLTEHMFWERHWKKQLGTKAYQNNPNKPNLIFDQIAGEGRYLRLQDQTDIPEAALLEITTAAKTPLLLTPDDAVPTQSFPTIKQGVDCGVVF